MRKILFGFIIFYWLVSPAHAQTDLGGLHFTFKGSRKDEKTIIENIYTSLQMPGVLNAGLPKFAKIEIIENSTSTPKIKANFTTTAKDADAIMFNNQNFVAFKVGVLHRPVPADHDIIILLKEPDKDAIRQGRKGYDRYKILQIDYSHLRDNTNIKSADEWIQIKKIVHIVRWGIAACGAKPLLKK